MTLTPRLPHTALHPDAATQPVNLRPALEEVRRMSEFQPPQPAWTDEIFRHPLVRSILDAIDKGFDQLAKSLYKALNNLKAPGLEHLPENIRDIFNGFLLFCIVLLLLYALYLLLSLLLRLQRERKEKPPAAANARKERPVSSAHHHARAEEAARSGHYDLALRELYVATLCLLDERAVAPYAETATSGEYLGRLSHKIRSESRLQPILSPFERLSWVFETSRYGLQPVSAGTFSAGEADFTRIQEVFSHG